MKLSEINENTPLVKDFTQRLSKSTKQQIVVTEVMKVARVSGASARPVLIALEGGQSVKIYLRESDSATKGGGIDLFRVDINGKTQPTTGDFDNTYKPAFNASVDEIASIVTRGQAAFSNKQAKTVVMKTKSSRAPQNKAQILSALNETSTQLDTEITTKTQIKTDLETKLEQVLKQNAA
ncbi:hypothetical protein [Psychrobacter sp.]|uniref:hypothetical protein n=1 Tax=Psychrobacter sp. TaxID=56811 RepID=UPI0025EAE3C5|nr:hypothetical protein [Psychrobacter sp.]